MIKVKKTPLSIVIEIPNELLTFVAENHPTDPMIIHDYREYINYIADYLENNADSETGLTGLQSLIDEAIWSCYENESYIESIKDRYEN